MCIVLLCCRKKRLTDFVQTSVFVKPTQCSKIKVTKNIPISNNSNIVFCIKKQCLGSCRSVSYLGSPSLTMEYMPGLDPTLYLQSHCSCIVAVKLPMARVPDLTVNSEPFYHYF